MSRWAISLLFAIAMTDAAMAADVPAPYVRHRARVAPPVIVERDPDVLFTPEMPYVPPLPRAALLPGSATIPGYYGSPRSFDYDGPYYGGRNVPYWTRLPYACGVFGYC